MSLAKHVSPSYYLSPFYSRIAANNPFKIDAEELLNHLKERSSKIDQIHTSDYSKKPHHTHFTYSSRYQANVSIPKFNIPERGTDGRSVHQLLKDELDLDGRPSLNLASFVSTYMEPSADTLMMEV